MQEQIMARFRCIMSPAKTIRVSKKNDFFYGNHTDFQMLRQNYYQEELIQMYKTNMVIHRYIVQPAKDLKK